MNSGGLIIWPAKFIILVGFILLLAQAISEIIKRVAVLAGILDDADEHANMQASVDTELLSAGIGPHAHDASKRDGAGDAR